MRYAWILLALTAGCFNPHYGSGDLKCSGDKCPVGFHCASDGTCWKNGSDPAAPDLAIAPKLDAGIDLSTPADLTPGADLLKVDLLTIDLQVVDLQVVDLLPALKHQSDPCLPTDTCDTGHCIDGFCCESTCDNLCQACNVPGSEGTCTTVPHGPPLGIGKSCVTSVPDCGGQCNGLNPTQCQYPGVTTVCSPSCASSTSETDHFCDGAGGCGAGTSTVGCSVGYECVGNSCLTQCSQASDCQPSTFACVGGSCVVACGDGVKDNGETDVDCGGPCAAKCAVNQGCSVPAECQTGSCISSFCQLVSGPPNWLPASPMPTAREDLAVGIGDDGHIYAIGGDTGTGSTVVTEGYDPLANKWSTGFASIPTSADAPGYATGSDGRIYVMGGFAPSGSPIGNVQAYRASTNGWASLAGVPTTRGGARATVSADGRIFLVGGATGFSLLGANEAYSIGSSSWAGFAALSNGTAYSGVATGADGRIYVVGNYTALGRVDAYNTSTNTWTQVASLTTSRIGIGGVEGPDGRIYAIGGTTSSALTEVDAYTPATNTWLTAPSLGTARAYIGTIVGPDGRIYAIGGGATSPTAANPVNTVEVYGPATTLSPTSGKKGASVTVAGSNFAASAAVSVYWGGTGGTLLGSGTTNASGVITTPISVTIPNVSPSPYPITVIDNHSQYPVTPKFTVTP